MNPICAQVDAASSCLRSVCATATSPISRAVAAPTHATAGAAHPVAASSGASRSSRYAPAATIVAECRSAETGLGPRIACDSQKDSGSCADFPSAATTNPAATTCSHGPCAAGRSASASEPMPPASAAPAAT